MKFVHLLLFVLILSWGAQAGTITLFNTGVDSTGTALTDGSVDPHYSDTTVGNTVFVIPKHPAWVSPGVGAKYVAPDTNQGGSYLSGLYTLDYVTSFDLTGLDPNTVSISGRWSTDNFGSDIFVNGHATGYTSPGFGSLTSFTLLGSSGFFTSGINTLDFRWGNSGGPGGVAVVFDSATAASSVPEPGSIALLGVGLAGLSVGIRRRSRR